MISPLLLRSTAVGGLVLLGAVAVGQTYRLTDLGSFGRDSYTAGINAFGQIAGASNDRAFLYDGTVLRDLGTLGGSISASNGVNASGHVVGSSRTSSGSTHAFIHDGTTMRDITPSATYAGASAINDLGQVVGTVDGQGFLYDGTTLRDIGSLGGGGTMPFGINLSGQVVGTSQVANGRQHAFLYSGGTMRDVGTLVTGGSSFLFGINGAGQAVGFASIALAGSRAVLFDGNGLVDLGTLGGNRSTAYALNSFGWVVGSSTIAGDRVTHMFLYKGGTMIDLSDRLESNPSGLVLDSITGINDDGLISAYGYGSDGRMHALLLTPVPEPATMAALGLGALGLLRRRKNR